MAARPKSSTNPIGGFLGKALIMEDKFPRRSRFIAQKNFVRYPKVTLAGDQRNRVPMPTLTRKRVYDRPVTWHVHYASVRVGMLVERSGVVSAAEPWELHCGFYPGGPHGEHRYGRAASLKAVRAAFEAAWCYYLPKCSEADYPQWRAQEAWTAEKYRRFDRHERVSPDWRAEGATR